MPAKTPIHLIHGISGCFQPVAGDPIPVKLFWSWSSFLFSTKHSSIRPPDIFYLAEKVGSGDFLFAVAHKSLP